jgi:hypothetical protein
MQEVNKTQTPNTLLNNTMSVFSSLSFYSPIIICFSIFLFSMFTGSMVKAFVLFVWIFIITFLRIIVLKGKQIDNQIPKICSTGLTEYFIPQDITYSTYLLTFIMMYFIAPMIMVSIQNNVNAMNYGVLAFFICYIALDLFIKNSYSCIQLFSRRVIGDILSGIFLGTFIAGILMYGSNLKSYLFINEINSNKEICSMPSKQQFKCNVYKDGTLVGNI